MNKVIAWGLGLLSLAVVHSTAAAAETATPTAGGVCINDTARQELQACPGAGPKEFDVGKHGKQPQVNFRGVPARRDVEDLLAQKSDVFGISFVGRQGELADG